MLVLRTQPRLRGALLGLGLVHIGILAGFTFLALRLLELGGQPSDVALSAGISALAEIPAMALIPRIVRRTGTRALLAGGMILYAVVLVSWAFLADPSLIVATRLVSGLAFAAITIAAVMTIANLLPPELQATGQGLYQTVGFGAAAVLANAVGGVVFGLGGAMPLFLGCAVLALIGAAVVWRVVELTASGGLAQPDPHSPSSIQNDMPINQTQLGPELTLRERLISLDPRAAEHPDAIRVELAPARYDPPWRCHATLGRSLYRRNGSAGRGVHALDRD